VNLIRQNDLENSECGEHLTRTGEKLTSPGEMQNVSKSDTSESQRVSLQPSMAPPKSPGRVGLPVGDSCFRFLAR
jgi:hypothetical protein